MPFEADSRAFLANPIALFLISLPADKVLLETLSVEELIPFVTKVYQ